MSKQPQRAKQPAPFVLDPQRADGEPYTTSEIIAAGTGMNHRRVRDAIRKYQKELETFGRVGAYQTPLPAKGNGISGAHATEIKGSDNRGRPTICYILNEQQATFLLTLLKNTPVVVAFKKELVRQFYAMRSLLLERASPIWQDTRSLGKEIRRQETEEIRRLVEYATAQGSQNAEKYYTTLSLLADRTVGITDRDMATVVQLTSLLLVEQVIAQEITAGIEEERPYRAIYQAVKDRLTVLAPVTCTG